MIFCSFNKLYKIKMTESFQTENQEVLLTFNKYKSLKKEKKFEKIV